MTFYEAACGARLHAALYRPNEVRFNYISDSMLNEMVSYLVFFLFFIKRFFQPVFFFRIFRIRLVGIGVQSKKWAKRALLSGPIGRSCGLKYDLRLNYLTTYAFYKYIFFKSFIGLQGDIFDRALIMIAEMVESCLIISQVILKNTILTVYNEKNS